VGLPLSLMFVIYDNLATPHMVLAMLIFIWINDTGAFCTGSLIGKHKLFERISPNKTWEGFAGGLIFCVVAAIIMRLCFANYFDTLPSGKEISLLQMICFGITVSIAATYGDLLESLFKRTCGVKDSGNIIPGHGGILDRIDSLLLVIPVSVIFFIIIN
ncbi:MAG: phosphatidate cytidylyltransferase, partial [Muribaculaceae bacterium]|nr:phosphatidate cytidylyltransferase [Muribaculaceae bacterium]